MQVEPQAGAVVEPVITIQESPASIPQAGQLMSQPGMVGEPPKPSYPEPQIMAAVHQPTAQSVDIITAVLQPNAVAVVAAPPPVAVLPVLEQTGGSSVVNGGGSTAGDANSDLGGSGSWMAVDKEGEDEQPRPAIRT